MSAVPAWEVAKQAREKVRVLAGAIEDLAKAVEILDQRVNAVEGLVKALEEQLGNSGTSRDEGSAG